MEDKDVVRALSALAQDVRLQIYRVLVVAGHTGMTPGALAEQLGVGATTLSFHLKELTNSALVTQERLLTANCCQGEACLDKAAAACKC